VNRSLLVSPDITLLQAMDALTKGEEKVVFVVDANEVLLGTLTDGDVRRFILAGNELSGSIRKAFNPKPVLVRGTPSKRQLRALLQAHAVDVVPVVDAAGRVVDVVSWHDAFEEGARPAPGSISGVPVVIMAGGVGTRLQPFTHVLPKPLVPIDGKPVIDHIIDRFRLAGVTAFYVTLNHKARILRAYLEDEHRGDITFIHEESPRGTAGSLSLLAGRLTGPVVVTNCDVLVTTNYGELLEFHASSGCRMTMVASVRTFRLPYGACGIGADGTLDGIEEKPEMTRLVNTGLYVLDARLFRDIPRVRPYDMTTLMTDLIQSGQHVAVFPVSTEAWIDVGQWEEYHRSAQLMARPALESEQPV